jgi:hypothetical protein
MPATTSAAMIPTMAPTMSGYGAIGPVGPAAVTPCAR